MSELFALTQTLRTLAVQAKTLADSLDRPDPPGLEVRDLIQRAFGVAVSEPMKRLQVDLAIDELIRMIAAPYADRAADLASELADLVHEDSEEEKERVRCLDCKLNTA